MGGQTALNCALDLADNGVLEKYGVELIGAKREAIRMAEDRELFRVAMQEIGLECPKAEVAHSFEEGARYPDPRRLPDHHPPELHPGRQRRRHRLQPRGVVEIVKRGLELSPTTEVLVEESVLGWKEFEMEVVRDTADNCIIVCSIENLDPMGVHTGDSDHRRPGADADRQGIPAPARCPSRCCARSASTPAAPTCSSASMRRRARGGDRDEPACVAFVGAGLEGHRLSRSPRSRPSSRSATRWTSCATRSPGGATPASFEPAIDYVVTKIPRFAFEKFPQADARLTTQMKSVGEVMAIGRTFQESLQKALRGLETGKATAWIRPSWTWQDRRKICERQLASPARNASGTWPMPSAPA
jgi:carbamoyl-phosphate synthase large subunit